MIKTRLKMVGFKLKSRRVNILRVLILMLVSVSCSYEIKEFEQTQRLPQIFPDYSGVTIPVNIAPLNFKIIEDADNYLVKVSGEGDESIIIKSRTGRIIIPSGSWKKILWNNRGKDLCVDVFTKKEGKWLKYNSIANHVSADSIDSHVAYRLIDPGFELWNKMGIYQRNLENFDERPIMVNSISEDNCMNCHSFAWNDSRTMLFHMRAKNSGTIIYREGLLSKVNTKTSQMISAGVYPSWHPGGRYVSFSVNNIVQTFHSVKNKVEVTDTLSDLIVYDIDSNQVFNHPSIASKARFETFPAWSPDGKYLYFCSAEAMALSRYNDIRYDLSRISFEASTGTFGKLDTIIPASAKGYSISFPRISPDGKYLMFCKSDFGNFSIWHAESDLVLLNLETGEITIPDVNSEETESYHSWSSDGRWFIFSSRRIDGLHTRLYISYFDGEGNAGKPFLLPQKDPDFYTYFLKSYNIPELITTAVDLNPVKLESTVYSDAVDATYKETSGN